MATARREIKRRCGAKRTNGLPCQAWSIEGSARCLRHSGGSTKPGKTHGPGNSRPPLEKGFKAWLARWRASGEPWPCGRAGSVARMSPIDRLHWKAERKDRRRRELAFRKAAIEAIEEAERQAEKERQAREIAETTTPRPATNWRDQLAMAVCDCERQAREARAFTANAIDAKADSFFRSTRPYYTAKPKP